MKSVCSIGAANTGAVEDNELYEPGEEIEDVNIDWDVNFTSADAESLISGKCAEQGIGK